MASVSRRTFALAAASLSAGAFPSSLGRPSPCRSLGDRLAADGACRQLGAAFISCGGSYEALMHAPELGKLLARPETDSAALAEIRVRVEADFTIGETFGLDGWTFARTEARLAALALARACSALAGDAGQESGPQRVV